LPSAVARGGDLVGAHCFARQVEHAVHVLVSVVPPKRLPSSIASLIVARYGISGQ
jgi:hypothetical protein